MTDPLALVLAWSLRFADSPAALAAWARDNSHPLALVAEADRQSLRRAWAARRAQLQGASA